MKTLTKRELEVADLIHQGLIEKEIAMKLSISAETVHTHKKHLLSKMNARNIADITRIFLIEIKGFATTAAAVAGWFGLSFFTEMPQFLNTLLN